MSDTHIAGLVCEGQTDVPILRKMIQALWPSVKEVLPLQPQLDEMERAKGPAGWTQVQSWCEQHASALDDVLAPDIGDPLDLLVVAIDIDIAIAAGIADPPQEVGGYESTRLRRTIEGWLKTPKRRKLPGAIVVSTPVMAIEAWVIAALFPRARKPEQIADGARWLVDNDKLRLSPKDGKPWKELHRYREFAQSVASNLARVRKSCAEAERTSQAIERCRDQLKD
ncbi:hypothetical protein [Polyangium fumosum]|uniref:DUF4276 family protein n=1 Tax=Polyangium fumosum TaxID=889272 RepID=A0A4U1IQU1_9BACT|nr:hypothetical protein [Polyangium fumosum]TKC96503.1 hypothetical protein E8A74_45025 [Polyangium fumosum]